MVTSSTGILNTLPEIPALVRRLHEVSDGRKAAPEGSPARRRCSRAKHAILSQAIVRLPEPFIDLAYRNLHQCDPLVLVRIWAERPACFHALLSRLSDSARCRVVNRIGTPGRYRRRSGCASPGVGGGGT